RVVGGVLRLDLQADADGPAGGLEAHAAILRRRARSKSSPVPDQAVAARQLRRRRRTTNHASATTSAPMTTRPASPVSQPRRRPSGTHCMTSPIIRDALDY